MASSHGRFILFVANCKPLEIRNVACLAGGQPSIKFVVLPLLHNLQELLAECVGLLHHRLLGPFFRKTPGRTRHSARDFLP